MMSAGLMAHAVAKRHAAKYYVAPAAAQGGIGSDANNGLTRTTPFATLAKADSVALAGHIVTIAPGSYPTSQAAALLSHSGTAAGHITYISEVKWAAKIVGGGTLTQTSGQNQAALEIKGNYIDVKGLEIDGSAAAANSWLYNCFVGSSHVAIKSCKFHDLLTDTTTFNAAPYGAAMFFDYTTSGTDGTIQDSVVFNVGPAGQTSSTVQGVYFATDIGLAFNNVVYAIVGDCITSWHQARNVHIINNTVDGAGSSAILVGANTAGYGGGFIVRNNISLNSAYGIREESGTDNTNIYANNQIFGCTTNTRLLNSLTDANELTSNPLVVNAGTRDYHLQGGSPAKNSGTATLAPARDQDGVTRSTTAPSRGAFE